MDSMRPPNSPAMRISCARIVPEATSVAPVLASVVCKQPDSGITINSITNIQPYFLFIEVSFDLSLSLRRFLNLRKDNRT